MHSCRLGLRRRLAVRCAGWHAGCTNLGLVRGLADPSTDPSAGWHAARGARALAHAFRPPARRPAARTSGRTRRAPPPFRRVSNDSRSTVPNDRTVSRHGCPPPPPPPQATAPSLSTVATDASWHAVLARGLGDLAASGDYSLCSSCTGPGASSLRT